MQLKILLLIIFTLIFSCARALEKVLEQLEADLNNDGIGEKIVVTNTDNITATGLARNISVFQMHDGNWELWFSSNNALLSSEHGGMMGDPFHGIEVENGILKIHHAGGSSWKWTMTDSYNFVNEKLVLFEHTFSYGKLCEYWITGTIDLLLGSAAIIRQEESCLNDEPETIRTEKDFFNFNKEDIYMMSRKIGKRKIISPKTGKEYFY